MADREFQGIRLEEHESIREAVSLSKAGLVVAWASIPSVLLVMFLLVYVPHMIRMAFSRAVKDAIMDQVGVDLNGSNGLSDLIFGNIPPVLIVLLCIPLVLLVAVWFGLCMYKTSRYFNYSLALTDLRIIGKAGQEELNAPLDEIVNVFVERSLCGKLFNYGNIVVATKRKSLTFKNVHNPKRMHGMIMSYAENYAAH